MTREEYWKVLVKRNPAFGGETVKIAVASLQRIVYQAHDKGAEVKKDEKTQAGEDIFSQFFGRKK